MTRTAWWPGVVLLVAVLAAGCGSSSPTSATPTTPAPAPAPAPTASTVTLSGHVTATNGGQALSGLSARLGAATVTTDGAGAFTAQTAPSFAMQLALTGSSIVPRTVTLAASTTRDVNVSAIALGGAFDLAFYQRFVRNAFDEPTVSQPIRRWTRTPQVYLKTVDEAGEPIHGPTLDLIEATIRDAVPRWTSGALGTPTITRGTETRVGVSGWITVRFPATQATTFCGQAQVGTDGGWVDLSYHVPISAPINCRIAGAVIAPVVVRHEFGHALGFYHTGDAADVMKGGNWTDGNQLPSARELYHAAIAYARPVGNVDPDTDPASAVNLAPLRVR